MITTGCIPKINPDDFDEVWWIVRSPDTIPVKEKLVLLVSELAPSPELFRDYRQAFHAGRFGDRIFPECICALVPERSGEKSGSAGTSGVSVQGEPDEKDCSLLLLRGRKPLPPEHHRRYPVGDGRSD